MLDAADVLVDRQPMVGHRRIVRRRRVVGIGEAHEVPRRIDERVHRVGLARRRATALRAGDVLPCRMTVERIARLIEAHVFRQLDRQVLGRDRHDAVSRAMDDRDRAAPIALAGNAPIPELVIDLPLGLRRLAKRDLLESARHLLFGLIDRHAIEEARIDHHAIAVIGLGVDGEVRGIELWRAHHRGHAQAIGADKIEVALIMGGAAEDRATAVVHQNEIGDIDGRAATRGRTGAAP